MSKITDHYVIAIRLRYSDSGKQHDMSNETQEAGIRKWLNSVGHNPHVAMVLTHEHSGYNPDAYELDEDLAKIKRYNRNNPNPITLLLHYNWKRWIRNSDEGNRWRYDFNKIGVEINTATKWLDFDNENDRLYLQFEQHMAENYSRSIGDSVVRANGGWRSRGYFPHAMTKFYFTREGLGTPERRNVWLPTRENLKTAIDMIAGGSTIKRAYDCTGGREVHGSETTFGENLRKDYMMARRGADAFNYEPITDELTWHKLQAILKSKKILTRDEKALQNAWLTWLIVADPCNRRVSRSTPMKDGKAKAKYYTCTCKPVRHYRVRREEAEADMLEVVRSIGLTANRQADLSKKAEACAENQLKRLKQEERRLTKKLSEAVELSAAAKRKYILDKISEKDLAEYQTEARVLEAQLGEVQGQIAKYGEILEAVKDTLSDIGTFLADYSNKLQLRDFLMMLFPDGVKYDPKKRQYRTTQINAAYRIIAEESVSYDRIKFGVAISEMTTPGMGGGPALSRTVQSDLSLFRNYLKKYA